MLISGIAKGKKKKTQVNEVRKLSKNEMLSHIHSQRLAEEKF